MRGRPPGRSRVTAGMEGVCGVKLAAENVGTDGCSMPAMATPLDRLAHGFARFVTGQGLAPERAKAAKRLAAAVAAEPFFVAGTGRFCTAVMPAGGRRFIAKTGAAGAYTAPTAVLRIGIPPKVRDRTPPAAQTTPAGPTRPP